MIEAFTIYHQCRAVIVAEVCAIYTDHIKIDFIMKRHLEPQVLTKMEKTQC